VGVDFVSKTINVENKSLRMQLWDTAGQERFHSLIPSYIKDSSAAIIVFDITSNTTPTYRRQFLQQPQQMDRQRQGSERRRGAHHDLRQ
jgi:GTPase SAR1 family protein